jgi:hypothetical protein
MDTLTASERLHRGRARIRQAMEQWNASDLEAVDDSRQLLALAVDDMREFECAARGGSITATGELHSTLVAVKQEIVQATRVVDACVAFHRGLAARLGDVGPGYDAAGHAAGESPGLEHEVHG